MDHTLGAADGFDHLFVTEQDRERLLRCEYIHEPRQRGFTDHAALALAMTW